MLRIMCRGDTNCWAHPSKWTWLAQAPFPHLAVPPVPRLLRRGPKASGPVAVEKQVLQGKKGAAAGADVPSASSNKTVAAHVTKYHRKHTCEPFNGERGGGLRVGAGNCR